MERNPKCLYGSRARWPVATPMLFKAANSMHWHLFTDVASMVLCYASLYM